MSKSLSKFFTVFTVALIAAAAIALGVTGSQLSFAAEPTKATLIPIKTDTAVKYRCFDYPNTVFADADGLIISCKNGSETIAYDMKVTSELPVPADKSYRVDGKTVVLNGGTLFRDGTNGALGGYSFTDFDIYITPEGATAYALTPDAKVVSAPVLADGFGTPTELVLSWIDRPDIIPSYITVCAGKVYIAAETAAMMRDVQDICSVDLATGELDIVEPQAAGVRALTSLSSTQTVYVLTADSVEGFKFADGGAEKLYTADNRDAITIFAYDGGETKYIYALDRRNALCGFSAGLTETKTFIAAASDEVGFFNTPAGVAVKHSTLYVADEVNGRIAQYGNELTYLPRTFNNPKSVASDSKGTLYIAHSGKKITMLRGDTGELTIDVPGGDIKQIAVTADKKLYILTADGLWVYRGGNSLDQAKDKLSDARYNGARLRAITLSAGKEELYGLAGNTLLKLTENGEMTTPVETAVDTGTLAAAIDLEGNIFTLNRNELVRIDAATSVIKRFPLSYTDELTGKTAAYTLGASAQLTLNAVKNAFLKPEGDGDANIFVNAVIVDSQKHRVFAVDGSESGIDIKLVGNSYDPPELDKDKTPLTYDTDTRGNGLIWTIRDATPLFDLPMDMKESYIIKNFQRVIVPQTVNPVPEAPEFALVLVDDLDIGILRQGFIYRDALDVQLPYSDPPTQVGSVYSDSTPVYKWPSPYSPWLDIPAYDRNTSIEILDFVMPYRDDAQKNAWYRVKVGDGVHKYEGFMIGTNLSLFDYELTLIRPAYNAEIIEYDGVTEAKLYELADDGKYFEIALDPLPVGTEVEVVDSYDTGVPFTKIMYFDEKLEATVICYVETVHIRYKGVNVVLLVVIIVMSVTIVLAGILIGRAIYVKKKRLRAPVIENVSDEEIPPAK